MKIDLLLDSFGSTWREVLEGALTAEGEGFDGVWLYDHLRGNGARRSPGSRVLDDSHRDARPWYRASPSGRWSSTSQTAIRGHSQLWRQPSKR